MSSRIVPALAVSPPWESRLARCTRVRGHHGLINQHDCFDWLGAAVRPDRAVQGASISSESLTAMKPDSSGTPDPHQPDQPDDTSGESASSPAEGDDPGSEEMILDYPDADVQNRLWLKAVVQLFQLRSHETDPRGRVQFAFDQMYIAASERVARILRCDLPASPG
jgi:hypothetical protein